jgi:hypothetical protein
MDANSPEGELERTDEASLREALDAAIEAGNGASERGGWALRYTAEGAEW